MKLSFQALALLFWFGPFAWCPEALSSASSSTPAQSQNAAKRNDRSVRLARLYSEFVQCFGSASSSSQLSILANAAALTGVAPDQVLDQYRRLSELMPFWIGGLELAELTRVLLISKVQPEEVFRIREQIVATRRFWASSEQIAVLTSAVVLGRVSVQRVLQMYEQILADQFFRASSNEVAELTRLAVLAKLSSDEVVSRYRILARVMGERVGSRHDKAVLTSAIVLSETSVEDALSAFDAIRSRSGLEFPRSKRAVVELASAVLLIDRSAATIKP